MAGYFSIFSEGAINLEAQLIQKFVLEYFQRFGVNIVTRIWTIIKVVWIYALKIERERERETERGKDGREGEIGERREGEREKGGREGEREKGGREGERKRGRDEKRERGGEGERERGGEGKMERERERKRERKREREREKERERC